MERLSINSPVKSLDFSQIEPCPMCDRLPRDNICIACPSSTIPHFRHGLEGICETCEGKSLVSLDNIYESTGSAESRAKALSEIQDRAVFPCASDAHVRTNGAYSEGEAWGDFLGPGFESTPSTAVGNVNGNADDVDHANQMESDRELVDSDRMVAKKIQAEWSESTDSKSQLG